nr:hypothetical protein [uncultured Cellulosilyticum sp.]
MIECALFVIAFLIMIITGIWTVFFEEKHMHKVIRSYIDNIRGELISIQYINKRGKVFIVEYKLGNEIIKQNVIYHIFGELEWL